MKTALLFVLLLSLLVFYGCVETKKPEAGEVKEKVSEKVGEAKNEKADELNEKKEETSENAGKAEEKLQEEGTEEELEQEINELKTYADSMPSEEDMNLDINFDFMEED